MHSARTKIYYSIIALSLGYGTYTLEAGFKKALDEKYDLDTLRVMAVSKSQALNEKRANETDPEKIDSIKKKILLSALRIQKIDEIQKLLETLGLESPLDEHYVMLKTVEVPSLTSQHMKEEVTEPKVKTSPTISQVVIQVEEDKEGWKSLISTPKGRSKVWNEAYELTRLNRRGGRSKASKGK